MDFELMSKLTDLRNSILFNNRFFNLDAPFLSELKKYIEEDLEREEPIMVSTLSKRDVLYRARIMDNQLESSKQYITNMMQQYGIEFDLIKKCETCTQNSECGQISSKESVESFKSAAKETLDKSNISCETYFNGFGKKRWFFTTGRKVRHGFGYACKSQIYSLSVCCK